MMLNKSNSFNAEYKVLKLVVQTFQVPYATTFKKMSGKTLGVRKNNKRYVIIPVDWHLSNRTKYSVTLMS